MTRLPFSVAVEKLCACSWFVAGLCMLVAQSGYAVQLEFQLQGPNSLVAAPFVNAVQMPMTGQDPGNTSLTTTYSGTITVDVDDPANPTSITFISAEGTAANSGEWLPEVGGGSEGDPLVDGDASPGTPMAANYGFFLDVPDLASVLYGAVRDLVVSVNSTSIPIAGGQFSATDIGITLPQATYESNLNSLALGDSVNSDDISDLTGVNAPSGSGSYVVAGNVATLTLPLDFLLAEGADPETRFSGTWTATYSLATPVDGDFNDDGIVDGADFLVWQRGESPDPLSASDLETWKTAFGGPAIAAVPEPTAALLMVAAMFGSMLGLRGARRSRAV